MQDIPDVYSQYQQWQYKNVKIKSMAKLKLNLQDHLLFLSTNSC